MSLNPNVLAEYVARQLANFFPDGHDARPSIQQGMPAALARVRHCVSQVRGWPADFDPLHSAHNATFLYYLANEVGVVQADHATATRLFLLNKALNGLELFYDLAMPEVFALSHTTGLVFAKATFGNQLVFHQNCTVGRKADDQRPVFGNRVVMFPGSMVIGHCRVRDNTVIAPGVRLIETDTPGDCYVLPGEGGRPIFKALKKDIWRTYFVS